MFFTSSIQYMCKQKQIVLQEYIEAFLGYYKGRVMDLVGIRCYCPSMVKDTANEHDSSTYDLFPPLVSTWGIL